MKRYVTKFKTENGSFILGGSGFKNKMRKNILDLEASGIPKKDIEIIPVKNDKTILGFIISGLLGIGLGIGIKSILEKKKKKKSESNNL